MAANFAHVFGIVWAIGAVASTWMLLSNGWSARSALKYERSRGTYILAFAQNTFLIVVCAVMCWLSFGIFQ